MYQSLKIEECNVLVVEDNITMLNLLVKSLENLGYRDVVTAMDGKEAWEVIEQANPPIHIILSDLLMPKVDGLQLLKRLRQSETHWQIPFLMVTGVDDLDKIMSVTEEHIEGYLVKPVTPAVLQEKILAALKTAYDPGPYHRAMLEGKRFLYEGRLDIALLSLEEARRLQPNQAAPYFYLAQIHEKQGELNEAETNYQRCKDCSNDLYVRALDGLSRIHIRKNEPDKAANALMMAIEVSPNNPDRHVDLSLQMNRLGDAEGASSALAAALKLTKREKKLPPKYIEACLNCGKDKQAEEIMHRNLGADTEEIVTLNHMGIVCRQRKEHQRAKGYYERALKISPSNDSVNYNYAVLLVEMKEYQAARGYLNRVLRQNPDFENATTLLAKMDTLGV